MVPYAAPAMQVILKSRINNKQMKLCEEEFPLHCLDWKNLFEKAAEKTASLIQSIRLNHASDFSQITKCNEKWFL